MVRVGDLGTGLFRVSSTSQAGVVAQPQVRPPLIAEPAASPQPASPPEPALTTNARLVINDTGFPLAASVVTIGRGSDAGIRIDDPGISRHHAEIRHSESGFSIIDLASTNGTLVAGERIGERALADGDEIRMGSTLMVFRSG
jgi:pSer/pThr/pTyr-binding forkhead associated (FHA) protein